MREKIFIVTGANSGLGKASALALAKKNANVVMLCRNREQGKAALAEIHQQSGNQNVELIQADLSSMESVRQFVATFKNRYNKLHGLLNCAGIIFLKRQVTFDGLETMFATNYLGHFLLTNLLFDSLKAGAPSRVVTVSGSGHKAGVEVGKAATIDFDDLQGEKHFSFLKASKQAVLAKILFTYELARKWAGTGITANTLCPGLTRTNLVKNLPWYVRLFHLVRLALSHDQTSEQGARHIIYLATSPELESVTGKYFEGSIKGIKEAESSPESYDRTIAERLWQVSEQLVRQRFDYGHLKE